MTIKDDTQPRKDPSRRNDRGAALILTVVVVMVLTTLALTMATFTTTEERTANTYRDSLQTRSVAEAGVRMVQEMFRTPTERALVPLYNGAAVADSVSNPTAYDYWGATDAVLDTQLNDIGIWRKDRPGTVPARYAGNSNAFFQPPFNGTWAAAFGGTYSPTAAADSWDLKLSCRNPNTGAFITNYATTCWLSKLNAFLVDDDNVNLDTGRITDISFYAPPIANGRAYGIATVRVTAEKRTGGDTGEVLARETIEAVIIDLNKKPAVLGDGDIVFKVQAGTLCGNGCEQIHANGDADVGSITGGTDPMVTAEGTVTGGATSKKDGAGKVTAPEINPWDVAYRPTNATELGKYYLVAARRLDLVWRDGILNNSPGPRACGLNSLGQCQDYNLEYTSAGVAKAARTATDTPYIYKWNTLLNEWTECGNGTNLSCSLGGPTFTVSRVADLVDNSLVALDTADLPFNKARVPKTVFQIQNAQSGATVLVDGQFYKHSAMTATMTIVAAGSIELESSTTWYPAMSNRTMWISGRDVKTHANCCAPSNTCATNLGVPSAAGIIAAHEQIETGSQNALIGLIIAENRVTGDDKVPGPLAINSDNGDHGSLCNLPDWPWTIPVKPGLSSMKSAAN